MFNATIRVWMKGRIDSVKEPTRFQEAGGVNIKSLTWNQKGKRRKNQISEKKDQTLTLKKALEFVLWWYES
jgi:hypothetical protein